MEEVSNESKFNQEITLIFSCFSKNMVEFMFELTYISFSIIDDANPKDPREKPVPPRPKGQRPEPETTGGSTFGGFGGFGGGKT